MIKRAASPNSIRAVLGLSMPEKAVENQSHSGYTPNCIGSLSIYPWDHHLPSFSESIFVPIDNFPQGIDSQYPMVVHRNLVFDHGEAGLCWKSAESEDRPFVLASQA